MPVTVDVDKDQDLFRVVVMSDPGVSLHSFGGTASEDVRNVVRKVASASSNTTLHQVQGYVQRTEGGSVYVTEAEHRAGDVYSGASVLFSSIVDGERLSKGGSVAPVLFADFGDAAEAIRFRNAIESELAAPSLKKAWAYVSSGRLWNDLQGGHHDFLYRPAHEEVVVRVGFAPPCK